MILPLLDDTIVAVATGWSPARLGIVRLSGPDALRLAAKVTLPAPSGVGPVATRVAEARVLIADVSLPASVYSFRAPRSYTGQDVVEIHTAGCLPLLRALGAEFVRLGARRALPGEFTARAFLNAKLSADQVDGVQALIHAGDDAETRAAARRTRGADRRDHDATVESLADLLARIEAGIDFVDEEDVRFVEPAEVTEILRRAVESLEARARASMAISGAARPHLALIGPPNAGKSSLFNALIGHERVIVSPLVGTTRDVIAADLAIDGRPLTLMDTAGVTHADDARDHATQDATRAALDTADLVAWVHPRDTDWTSSEQQAFESIPPNRRLLVLTKCDLPPHEHCLATGRMLEVSVVTGTGLADLRLTVAARLKTMQRADGAARDTSAAQAALRRALALAPQLSQSPELLSSEVRAALTELDDIGRPPSVEETLGRIFRQFCVGK